MDAKDEVVVWAAGACRSDRLDYIKKLLDCCPLEENKPLMRLVENTKKRKLRELERVQNKKPKADSSAPAEPIGYPASLEKAWWSKYKDEDIVGMDCEFVELEQRDYNPITGKYERVIRAATVSIVRLSDKKEIYSGKVRHESGSFVVTHWTRQKNGFGKDSLVKGEDFGKVKQQVEEVLRGKLVILCGGKQDLECLDLSWEQWRESVMDLQWHWKKWNGTISKLGLPNMNALPLKSLTSYYLKRKIQTGHHSAREDALATVELFAIYKTVKQGNLTEKHYDPDIYEFKDIPFAKELK